MNMFTQFTVVLLLDEPKDIADLFVDFEDESGIIDSIDKEFIHEMDNDFRLVVSINTAIEMERKNFVKLLSRCSFSVDGEEVSHFY